MADTGLLLGGAAVSGSGGITAAWSNPSNVLDSSDANFSGTSLSIIGGTSHALEVTGFDFSAIPSGATINGVEARIRRSNSASGNVQDGNIRLMVAGAAAGDNKAAGGNWPSSLGNADYGGAADLWGLSLSAAQVKASDFGLSIVASRSSGSPGPRIAAVWLRVTYTASSGFNRFSVRSAGSWKTPDLQARHSGSWKAAKGVWVRQSGSWVRIFDDGL